MKALWKKLWVFAILFLLLAGAVVVIWWVQYQHVPRVLQYVPQDYKSFAVSRSLRNISSDWEVVFPNLFSDQGGYLGREAPNNLRIALSEVCIESLSTENLIAMGLDVERPAVYSEFKVQGTDVQMYVLPASNKDRLLNWIAAAQGPELVKLQWHGEASPDAFELSLLSPENGVLCETGSRRDGRPVTFGSEPIRLPFQGEMPKLFYLPLKSGALQLNCRAIYKNGSSSTCDCNLQGKPCIKTPLRAVNLAALPLTSPEAYPAVKLNEDLTAVIPPGNDIIIYDSDDYLHDIPSIQSKDNFRYHFSRMRFGLEAHDFSPDVIAKLSRSVLVPGAKTYLSIRADQRDLEFSASIPSSDLGVQSVHQLLTPGGQLEQDIYLPQGIGASAAIQDRYLSDYLGFYHKNFYDDEWLKEDLGNYHVIYRHLLGKRSLSSIVVYLNGFQQGIPKLTLAIGMDSRDAKNYVNDMQREFRSARDLAILNKLYEKYPSDFFKENISNTNKLTSRYLANMQARNLFKSEAENDWDRYDFFEGRFVLRDPNFDLSDSYVVDVAGSVQMEYLLPSSTDNDIALLYEEHNKDEIDVEAILAGDYRMVAAYDSASSLLWVTDLPLTMQVFLYKQLPEMKDKPLLFQNSRNRKVFMFADIPWLRAQTLLHPDTEASEELEVYLDAIRQFNYFKVYGEVADGNRVDVKSRFIAR